MKVKFRYTEALEKPHTAELELHKNNKGYNINLNGKYYFPKPDNPVIKNIAKFESQELWVVIQQDHFNYANIGFAVPDFFVRTTEDQKSVFIEKEIPCNRIDDPTENPFTWEYVTIATLKVEGPDLTDQFIDQLEAENCPEPIIKEALNQYYGLLQE